MSSAASSTAVTLKDFDKICRTCLTEENLGTIQGTLVSDMTVKDLFECSIMMEVNEDDSLPQNICENCLIALYKIYEFKKLCQNNENILKSLVQKDRLERTEIKEEVFDVSDVTLMEGDKEYKDNPPEEYSCEEIKIKVIENSSGRYKCSDCAYVSSSKKKMHQHRKKAEHGYCRKCKCDVCNKAFNKSRYNLHVRTHSKEQPYQCDICSLRFSERGNLKRHKMIHTGERPHVCGLCGKGFIQSTSLRAHEKTHQTQTETDTPEFTCNICGRGFKCSAHYRIHLRRHAGFKKLGSQVDDSETRDHLCDMCGRAFKSKHLLNQHKVIHGEKSFLCSTCGKSFSLKASLKTHLKTHTGEKPYTCTVCKKSFTQSSTRDVHMLIHENLKPHKCTYCSKSFNQQHHLTYHLRTHSGEKPYTCTYCNKSFAIKGTLTVHIRTHTGETPYVCPVCGKGFYDSSSMKKHHKRHKVEQLEEAESKEGVTRGGGTSRAATPISREEQDSI